MKDSIYVLSKQQGAVEKLHLCTWDVRNHNTFVEVGVSIANDGTLPDTVELYLVLPFLSDKCKIKSLHEELHDNDNYKFIFNEIPENVKAIDGEIRNGSIVQLAGDGDLKSRTHLVANANTEQDKTLPMVKVSFERPEKEVGHAYVRLLIETDKSTIAEVIPGIAKRSYIFDVKINEARNIPSDVLNFKRKEHLNILPVKTAYCLHCVPDNYEITFSDSSKMKNIRKLEKEAFQRYLPVLKNISGEYIITFIKHKEDSGSYSFFTTFNKEVVGNKQLFVAVITNLLCNLLFAIAAFRVVKKTGVEWYKQIPGEWWVAVFLIALGLIICLPLKSWAIKFGHWIKSLKKR